MEDTIEAMNMCEMLQSTCQYSLWVVRSSVALRFNGIGDRTKHPVTLLVHSLTDTTMMAVDMHAMPILPQPYCTHLVFLSPRCGVVRHWTRSSFERHHRQPCRIRTTLPTSTATPRSPPYLYWVFLVCNPKRCRRRLWNTPIKQVAHPWYT
jgi:hypothetical protein